VVTGWYIPDQATPYTQSIAKRLEADRAIVPALWQLEFANVLKTACTRGKLSLETAREIVVAIAALPIELDSGLAPGPRQLLDLAMRVTASAATMPPTSSWLCVMAYPLPAKTPN